jgi:hypothetical protein
MGLTYDDVYGYADSSPIDEVILHLHRRVVALEKRLGTPEAVSAALPPLQHGYYLVLSGPLEGHVLFYYAEENDWQDGWGNAVYEYESKHPDDLDPREDGNVLVRLIREDKAWENV